jgi:hypothetical protein
VKHPVRSSVVQNASHLSTKPGDILQLIFGPLKAATTKACLNKIFNDYVVNVTHRKSILSDNGTEFASQI